MSVLDQFVSEVFRLPGGRNTGAHSFLHRAACAHRTLLSRAADDSSRMESPLGPVLKGIGSLIGRIPRSEVRDRFLLDPTFVQGLHEAAGESLSLADWHRHVADPDPALSPLWPGASSAGANHLGNAFLGLLLRDDPHWCGRVLLQTDLAGRLRFPLSDWSIALWSRRSGPGAPLSQRDVTCRLSRHDMRMSLCDRPNDDLLVMPRREWLRMLVDDDGSPDARQIQFAHGDVGLALHSATSIPGWRVRYDPVGIRDPERHASLTGGLVHAALEAIAHHAPTVAAEFDALVSVVRGWDLPPADSGTLQSFSDPTLPRVMGINVPWTADDQPQLCPFCFSWFGHELGHTKSYLIESMLYVDGHSLTSSHGQSTSRIPRYGRMLPMRTLLQIPYTHLYEWMLMIRFLEGGFSAVPWTISGDPIAYAQELHVEIEEAFDRIGREVPLSAAGKAVIARLHTLDADVSRRWQRLRRRAALVAGTVLRSPPPN
jgi:hypothetical protein